MYNEAIDTITTANASQGFLYCCHGRNVNFFISILTPSPLFGMRRRVSMPPRVKVISGTPRKENKEKVPL